MNLKKAGKNYLALCPFHSEKTPSFTVSSEKQIFHCFGCGVSGNVFNFLMKYSQVSFPEAVKMLGEKYGVQIYDDNLSSYAKKQIQERQELFLINQIAQDFFQKELFSQKGKKALDYLYGRKITKKTIDEFYLGYAPDSWNDLLNFLIKKGFSKKSIARCGLIVSGKNQSFYDKFRNRIIFPIFDANGKTTAFGGRSLKKEDMPKYLNSPETPIFHKRKTLYGLNLSKEEIRDKDLVYIVEGYMDLIALYQHGIKNVVATLGTSINIEHLRNLKGYSKNTILVFDGDSAGINAIKRSIPLFLDEAFSIRVFNLEKGHDPDSYIFAFGKDAFLSESKASKSFMLFLFQESIKQHGLLSDGKINIVKDSEKLLSQIDDKYIQRLYIKELSELIDVDEQAILQRISAYDAHRNTVQQNLPSLDEPKDKIEEKIISMMLQFQDILDEIENKKILDYFIDNDLKEIGMLILKNKSLNKGFDASNLISFFEDQNNLKSDDESHNHESKVKKISSLSISEEEWTKEGSMQLINQFILIQKKHKKENLLKQIQKAEKEKDAKLLQKLLIQYQRCD